VALNRGGIVCSKSLSLSLSLSAFLKFLSLSLSLSAFLSPPNLGARNSTIPWRALDARVRVSNFLEKFSFNFGVESGD